MKKNKMMRAASALLVAVLLTTCAVSGTFAKYTTQNTSQDVARVAKFGVEVTGKADMFDTTYAFDEATVLVGTSAVQSGTTNKVLAPGTTGELTEFVITGTPEVATRVTYEATTFDITDWKVETADYIPITVTVSDGTTTLNISGAGKTEEQFETEVIGAIKGDAFTKEYAPGTDLSTVNGGGLTVSWTWPFDGDDAKDTALGGAVNPAKINITVKCTVTQID